MQRLEWRHTSKDADDLLTESVDYGTNLVARAFGSSKRDLIAICLLFVQLRQFLMHLDGITILLREGSAGTADLQLRSLALSFKGIIRMTRLFGFDRLNRRIGANRGRV